MKIFKAILFLSCVALVFANENTNKFNNVNYRWDFYVKGKTSDNREQIFCRILIIKPRVFLTSASCIHRALSENPYQRLSTYTSSFGNVQINANDIYYNEDFSHTYDPSKRDVAMVVVSQPFTINEMMFTLPNNMDDIDYSSCYNPINGRLFSCTTTNNYYPSAAKLSCSDTAISAYPGDPIICSSNKYPNIPVLAGFKISYYINTQNKVEIINSNLGDLKNNIDRKLRMLSQIYYFK